MVQLMKMIKMKSINVNNKKFYLLSKSFFIKKVYKMMYIRYSYLIKTYIFFIFKYNKNIYRNKN